MITSGPSRHARPSQLSTRVLLAVLTVLLSAPTLLPVASAAATTRPKPSDDGFSATKTIGRTWHNADGSTYAFPSYQVVVNVDHTRNLRGRQRVHITWSGAQPSGGRASNPFGENGLMQEYPVVILQCRGLDDANLPAAKQLTPSTCFTTSVAQRSQVQRSGMDALWTVDANNPEAERVALSGIEPFPSADVCPTASTEGYFTHLTPFVTAKGTVFPACDATSMPPEAAVGSAYPANDMVAFTNIDGTGSVRFEVRSDAENESLGCSDKVACSIVVVPITGIDCMAPGDPAALTPVESMCRKGGQWKPGSSNFAAQGIDQAVGPALWWSGSNWRNRITVPITFGLPPSVCDVLDPRPPTGFYGSELLGQAALQWTPAYCLNKQRFKFQMNQMSDDAGWNLMTGGGGVAAMVSSKHPTPTGTKVAYAPTAVTGFGIGYVIDRPDNAGEYTDLRLNPRLIAKLLTQSYPASGLGQGHPGLEKNPVAIMNDPEFIKLNPGLSQISQEAGAALLSLSNSSDVMTQLTDYLAQDPDAMAFIKGKRDPWGMQVNPSYKNITLPRADWPLLDKYVPKAADACHEANPMVYLTQVAAPVATLHKVSTALLDGWPNVQTRCDFDAATSIFKIGRIERQPFGSRFMLGIVALGDADRYGLRSAALQAKPGTYVAPNTRSLAAAVDLLKKGPTGEPFTLKQSEVRQSRSAYPGTMVVYTAAKSSGLDKQTADKLTLFIKTSTTEGQRAGYANGELPGGYLPISAKGPTAELFEAAQTVAQVIKNQKPAAAPGGPSAPKTDAPGAGTSTTRDSSASTAPITTDADATTPDGTVPDSAAVPAVNTNAKNAVGGVATQPVAMPATARVSAPLSRSLVPLLVLIGLLSLLAAGGIRVVAARQGRRG